MILIKVISIMTKSTQEHLNDIKLHPELMNYFVHCASQPLNGVQNMACPRQILIVEEKSIWNY